MMTVSSFPGDANLGLLKDTYWVCSFVLILRFKGLCRASYFVRV